MKNPASMDSTEQRNEPEAKRSPAGVLDVCFQRKPAFRGFFMELVYQIIRHPNRYHRHINNHFSDLISATM